MTVAELRVILAVLPGDAPVLVGPSRSADLRCAADARAEIVVAQDKGEGQWFPLSHSTSNTVSAGAMPRLALLVRE